MSRASTSFVPQAKQMDCRVKPGNEVALKSLDQAGVDQQPVEAARFRAAGAGVEQSFAALKDSFLLGEGRIERQAGGLLHDQREIRTFNGVEGGREIDGFEIDHVECVVGCVIAWI